VAADADGFTNTSDAMTADTTRTTRRMGAPA
jgi:hypothetical protein